MRDEVSVKKKLILVATFFLSTSCTMLIIAGPAQSRPKTPPLEHKVLVPAPTLNTLPAPLIDRIVSYLGREDAQKVKSVNWRLYAVLQPLDLVLSQKLPAFYKREKERASQASSWHIHAMRKSEEFAGNGIMGALAEGIKSGDADTKKKCAYHFGKMYSFFQGLKLLD